jgi:hypothetical protein
MSSVVVSIRPPLEIKPMQKKPDTPSSFFCPVNSQGNRLFENQLIPRASWRVVNIDHWVGWFA